MEIRKCNTDELASETMNEWEKYLCMFNDTFTECDMLFSDKFPADDIVITEDNIDCIDLELMNEYCDVEQEFNGLLIGTDKVTK